ncbi:MAG: DNA-processing protein DprA [Clostridia bacterium]|nr:DNA-processing protein DprA [Clostridia bacterium]
MSYTNEQLAIMALYGIPGVGVRIFRALVGMAGSAQAALENAAELALQLKTKPPQAVLDDLAKPPRLNAIPEALEKCGARAVFLGGEGYPQRLSEIDDPPPLLYVKGALPESSAMLAVVGSRAGTRAGLEAAKKLSEAAVLAGAVVVSGGARGVDTAAHMGALSACGRTVAVLPCGINACYPQENAELFRRIEEKGAIVTECAPGAPVLKGNFHLRNRIISGLATAVMVVEAEEKSGAMITMGFAAAQGRPLLAVPGAIMSPFAQGPHSLLKKGAAPVYDAETLLKILGLGTSPGAPKTPHRPPDETEQAILALLRRGDQSLNDIVTELGISAQGATVKLTGMTLDGIITVLPGNRYGFIYDSQTQP